MKLHEYQSKLIFAKYGIPIPKGRVAATAEEARTLQKNWVAALLLNRRCLVGGRGKAGGIRLAKNPRRGRRAGQSDPGYGDQRPTGAQSAGR